MNITILKESAPDEKRVAATPETVKKMRGAGFAVWVQQEAGVAAGIADPLYAEAGATLAPDLATLFAKTDLFLKVQKPSDEERDQLHENQIWISFLQPFQEQALIQNLAQKKVTAFSMEMIPRIARAQRLDALSSQSNVAGYKAVLLAANKLDKMFPLMMTAAGTISPAKVLVIGAGVAGLQAIATAHRLGAVVEAYDTRPAVKEQVESLGALFVQVKLFQSETETKGGYAKELSKEDHEKIQETLTRHVQQADVVITTAAIPGKPSPKIITEKMVQGMKPGSVIVDLAAEGGGNCVLTEPGKEVLKHNVWILGKLNIPSLMAAQSSQLYARNVYNLLLEITKDGNLKLNLEDEIVRGSLLTHQGNILWKP